ncbi:MAG: hypothetical protein HDR19_05510 [Lachnospiraceae bacterium]|nr:hypothetical protein [Lachnospiraceae bacterium]
MKKITISILVILTIGIILFIAIKGKETDDIQIRTDIAPIYNHFPDLPATETIQWCSKTSSGIGLTTVWVYTFAFYDHDISAEFSEAEILDDPPDFYFLPENFAENHSNWRKLENMDAAFQSGIKDSKKMRTSVYLNETGNILYMEAIGD